MARLTVDTGRLMVTLYTRDFPGYTVMRSADVNQALTTPCIIVQTANGRMVENGDHTLGWVWDVAVQLIHFDEEIGDLDADKLYQVTHGYDEFGDRGRIDGIGAISLVEDISMPSYTGSNTPSGADGLHSFEGVFSIIFRKPEEG